MGGEGLGGRRVKREEVHGIIEKLKSMNFFECCQKHEICGSYRRGEETSGDIDIVFIPNYNKYNDWIFSFKGKKNLGKWCDSVLIDGVQVDFFPATEDNYYCQILMWTGPPNHNIILKGKAILRNMTFSSEGMTFNGRKITGINSEEDIFILLGKKYLAPNDRGRKHESFKKRT
jgi:DNA polymerase/3'-5' exonuclease PolX